MRSRIEFPANSILPTEYGVILPKAYSTPIQSGTRISPIPELPEPLPIISRSPTPNGFPIVGIGASAGGLEAFLELLGALPPDTGMAFVLVQHLEPNHSSHLTEILARATSMPVEQAANGAAVQPNHVYVIPPNVTMIVKDRFLQLSPRSESPVPHHPIDFFFNSLAQDVGSSSIGVVLSGSSNDGAQGLRMIKCAAGTTFAQDEKSARFGGMPHNAISTGAVDIVLPPARLAEELARISLHPLAGDDADSPENTSQFERERDQVKKILDRIRLATKVDFSQYKQNTIRRRIARRMLVNNVTSVGEYAAVLEKTSSEIGDLYRDLLISVTSFFREPLVYEALAKMVAGTMRTRDRESAFRVWVAGCATGEEAYSLAILIRETMEAEGISMPLQLFGTDVSEIAIDRARAAIYPDLIQNDVSAARLRKFFTRRDSGYSINKSIRDNCVFARHDIIRDLPFSQIDLVSCRNVLIYLGPAAQQRVVPALHYSLKTDGVLLLGSAETIGSRSDIFDVIDGENKIFSKKVSPKRFTMTLPDPIGFETMPAGRVAMGLLRVPTIADIENRATRILRDTYSPAGVIVDDSMQILSFHGQTGRYLQAPAGEASLNLLRAAKQDLVMPLRRAIDASAAQNEAAYESLIPLHGKDEVRHIGIRVIPFTESEVRYFLILFEDPQPSNPAAHPEIRQAGDIDPGGLNFQLAQARRELAETREYLRTIVEQHEVATEELRAANEEVQSSNEELQSTNEEIRTAKEELQSSNEELTTVNEELHNRNNELRVTNNDLSNVLNAVGIPIVMVDMDSRIRSFTPAAEKLLNSVPSDVGRTITDIGNAGFVSNLGAMVRDAILTLAVQESRAQSREGRWYTVFVRPYRTVDDRIDGAVITFLDVSQLTQALELAKESRDLAEGIVETVQHPLLVLDNDLRIQRATAAFYKTFQVTEQETRGIPIFKIGNGQWNNPQLRALLEQALVRDIPFRELEVEQQFPNIGRKTMRLNARRIIGGDHNPQKILLAIEDVTERKEAAEIHYRRLFESAKDAIIIIDVKSGLITDVNPYFIEMSRYSHADITGKRFDEIEPFRKEEAGRLLVPACLEHEIARFDSVPLHAQDGRQLVVEMIANRYTVKESSLIQINIRDVTQRRQAEEQVRRSNLDLQQFAFAASHDLQEPLRTVINQAQFLQQQYQGKLGADADEMIAFITSASDRMRHMILDLLSYAHMSRATMHVTEIQAELVLAAALSNLQLAIRDSNARITFDALPSVEMDQAQLLQLLQILIGNAIKFRGPQPPHIHISARMMGNSVEFSIADNGLGFDPKDSEHIFTIFRRLQGKEYPGTGIGLAIGKRIVERHGGRIWVESRAGEGSTFFFSMPVSPVGILTANSMH